MGRLRAAHGIERRIGLRVHHFSTLPAVVVECGMAAVVPWLIARQFAALWPPAVRELPVPSPEFAVDLYRDPEIGASGPVARFLRTAADALVEHKGVRDRARQAPER